MNQDDFTIHLTFPEIEWILQQLGAPPRRLYVPLNNLEASDGIDGIPPTLRSRAWINFEADVPVAIDIAVAGIVGVLGFSTTLLLIDHFCEQDHKPQTYQYFYAQGLIVEQTVTDDKEVKLTALRDLDTLRTRLHKQINLVNQQKPTQTKTFECEEEAFAAIPYTLAGDGESAAIAQFVEIGADEHFAADLISAMNAPVQQATLQVVHLDTEQPEGVRLTGKLNLLEGVYGLWALRSQLGGAVPLLEIMPCNAEHARELVDTLLGTFIACNGET